MATAERHAHPCVRDRLYDEFYRFTFFQAVSLLERMAEDGKGLGEELLPGREPVRFSVQPGFCFPPSDLADLKAPETGGQPLMEVAFLGLIGPSGILPRWYNELAFQRKGQKDGAMTAFLDIFQHRLLSLFYLAWKKYRLPEIYRDDAKDRFSFQLRCLLGLGTDHLSGKLGLPDEAQMFFGGIMSRRVPTAGAVEAAVEYYFQVKAEVDQFVPRLLTLEPEERTAIGKANSTLGVDTVCGSQMWETQTKFRVKLGPMPYASYLTFLPSGDRLQRLCSLVRFQVGIEYEFEVEVILKREDVPSCRLGGTGDGASRLGWTTWVKSPLTVLECDPHARFGMQGIMECSKGGAINAKAQPEVSDREA